MFPCFGSLACGHRSGAGTGSAQAAPITFTSQTSAVETYFQFDPAISATVQFQGLTDTLDLTTGVGVHARFLLFYVGTGAADPGVSGIEYRPFSVGLTVQGITRYFEFDLGVQEILHDQYQVYQFAMPELIFDLGTTGLLTVTPNAFYTQSGQLLANSAAYHSRDLYATFLLSERGDTSVPEPGSLALVTLAAGALWGVRRRRVPAAAD